MAPCEFGELRFSEVWLSGQRRVVARLLTASGVDELGGWVRQVPPDGDDEVGQAISILNELSAQGWEFVERTNGSAQVTMQVYLLRRPLVG